jgi:hypothetical protein
MSKKLTLFKTEGNMRIAESKLRRVVIKTLREIFKNILGFKVLGILVSEGS